MLLLKDINMGKYKTQILKEINMDNDMQKSESFI